MGNTRFVACSASVKRFAAEIGATHYWAEHDLFVKGDEDGEVLFYCDEDGWFYPAMRHEPIDSNCWEKDKIIFDEVE